MFFAIFLFVIGVINFLFLYPRAEKFKFQAKENFDKARLDNWGEKPHKIKERLSGAKALVNISLFGGIGCLILTLVITLVSWLVVVDAGHVGFTVLFGKVQPTSIPEGLHTKNLFAKLMQESVRTREYTMSAVNTEGEKTGDDAVKALSSDGLYMPLEVTFYYRLLPDAAWWVYQNIGRDYPSIIMRPSSRTSIREAVSKYKSQEIYAEKREEVAIQMSDLMRARVDKLLSQYENRPAKVFEIPDVMLRNVDLPLKVKDAIEAKLKAQQEAEQMEFVLDKERKEAERKEIEAKGIKTFQDIVSSGITPGLLKWKGIEATKYIADSPNAKVIIIGTDEKGMPIILGGN